MGTIENNITRIETLKDMFNIWKSIRKPGLVKEYNDGVYIGNRKLEKETERGGTCWPGKGPQESPPMKSGFARAVRKWGL